MPLQEEKQTTSMDVEATADAIITTEQEKKETGKPAAIEDKAKTGGPGKTEEQPERRGRGRPPGSGRGRGRPPKAGRAKVAKKAEVSKENKSQPAKQPIEAPPVQIELPQFLCVGCQSTFSVVGNLYSHYPFCSSFRRRKGLPVLCARPEDTQQKVTGKAEGKSQIRTALESSSEPKGGKDRGGEAATSEVAQEAERRSMEWVEMLGQLIMSLGDVPPPSEAGGVLEPAGKDTLNMAIESPAQEGTEPQRPEADEGRPVVQKEGDGEPKITISVAGPEGDEKGERQGQAEQREGTSESRQEVRPEEKKRKKEVEEDGERKEYSELCPSAVLTLVKELKISNSDTFLNIGSGTVLPPLLVLIIE